MTEMKCVVFLVVLAFPSSLSNGDTEVSCVFNESCVLPCSFHGADVVIHWIQMKEEQLYVHSFYNNQDQLQSQSPLFIKRTSLFQDEISKGNGSLQLTGVKVQDEGRYQCYTSTANGHKSSFVAFKVEASVSEVSIDQVGNRITCSSNWIYPEPELTWSTSPPSNMKLQDTASVQQTEQQLYNISSSLILSDSDTDLIYSCTVSTRTSSRRATFKKRSNKVCSPNPVEKQRGRGGVIAVVLLAAAAALAALVLYNRSGQQNSTT